jgi:transcriptional regulator with XRE-family HTH domain
LENFFQNYFTVQSNDRISKFYTDLEKMDLRFPVAEIVRKLKVSKGYVSEVLSRKKEPSEDFINRFYQEFSKGSQPPMTGNYELPVGNLKVTLLDYVELLKEQNRKLESREAEYLKILKESLTALVTSSKGIADDIAALTMEVQAEHRAIMDTADKAAEQPIGTTRAAARTVELASHAERSKKGKAESRK